MAFASVWQLPMDDVCWPADGKGKKETYGFRRKDIKAPIIPGPQSPCTGLKFSLMGTFTFSRQERLTREKWIKELFKKGSSFHFYPFRVIHLPHPEPQYPCHQVYFGFRRNFKKAVDRNLLKRRTRESYRLQKAIFPVDSAVLIAYIYNREDNRGF